MKTTKASHQPTLAQDLFAQQATHLPDAIAATFEGSTLTYRDLDRQSNQLANYLRSLGCGPERMVGVFLDRSLEMVVTLLAIFKAGGGYLPLDTRYPRDRLGLMLEDCAGDSQLKVGGPPLLVTSQRLADKLPDNPCCTVLLDRDQAEIASSSADPFDRDAPYLDRVTPGHRAYVIFTSGSTGRPKGVVVEHRGLANLIAAQQQVFDLGPNCRVLQFSPYSFDASLFEMVMALMNGGTLVLAPQSRLLPGPGLIELLRDEEVTHLTIPPSALAKLPHEPLPSLRQLIVAGEACAPSVVQRWGRGRQFFNAYGPTESTVWSTVAECSGAAQAPPIGRPIHGLSTHLLTPNFQTAEDGELCLAGVGLARGYQQRPALTARSFVPNPAAELAGDRLYRTGDRARKRSTGELDYLGRIDRQIKLRGQRIELGEIESRLVNHPEIAESVVLLQGQDDPDKAMLVAYIVPQHCSVPQHFSVPQDQEQIPAPNELRRWLREALPEIMVPAAFVSLEAFPLTGNGKINRSALPVAEISRATMGSAFEPPRGATEQQVADVFSQLLGVEPVGRSDNFFELGGHSLLVTRLVTELRERFRVDLPLAETFTRLTTRQLAEMIDSGETLSETEDGPSAGPRPASIPLSFAQERVWFVQTLHPDAVAYHAAAVLTFEGHLDVTALERSLSEMVVRHEVLRTTFPAVDGEPVQRIHSPWPVSLDLLDLTHLDTAMQEEEIHRRFTATMRQPFDMAALPLIRWLLVRQSEQRFQLFQVEHHLIHDGWSFNVLLGELVALYRAFAENQPAALPALPLQFADFACWQRRWTESEAAARQLTYWRQTLGGAPVLELPLDKPRPPAQSFAGEVLKLQLDAEQADRSRALAQHHDATIYQVLLSTFLVLLHRLTGQHDLSVGSGIANRRWRQTETLAGMIINNLVLRNHLAGDPSFRQLLAQVRQSTLSAYAHQDVPFDRVVDAVDPVRDASRNPLFQAAFSFHDSPIADLALPDVELDVAVAFSNRTAKFDLSVIGILHREQRTGTASAESTSGVIDILFEYNTALFHRSSVERWMRLYQRLLDTAVANPELPLSQLGSGPVVPQRNRSQSTVFERTVESHHLLVEWNDTATDLTNEQMVHHVVEHYAQTAGDNLAVALAGSILTYDQLNRRSNRLAHQLRTLGAGPESLIAVFARGGPNMVVGLLAVLKAGAAYVPIDPAYPADRITFVLDDSAAVALLTTEELKQHLPSFEGPVIRLDETQDRPLGDDNPAVSMSPENLAYVIYTSGSTGRPKGVQITHRGLANLVRWHHRTYTVTPQDRATQLASPAFDASVWEIWPYLTAGASVHFPGEEIRLSPADLLQFFADQAITLSFAPTPLAEAMLDEPWPDTLPLRALLTGGDRLRRRPPEQAPPLINHYGPSENSVVATWAPVATGAGSPPPIGRPLDNVQGYLVDQALRPAMQGVAAVLTLGGVSLGRGYLARPALTATNFVPDPFGRQPGARLYWTGDRVRHLAGGQIDFLGRVDHQVKIRGFRIELGEIEVALQRHPRVHDAVVIVHEDDNSLVAYVVPVTGDIEASELDEHLRAELPPYIVPHTFVQMSELPLGAHGKVDRKALPAPVQTSEPQVAPRDATELRIANICEQLLGHLVSGVRDDFFRSGGNSLLATRVLSRVNQAFAVQVPLGEFLAQPTVAALAQAVRRRQGQSSAEPIERFAWRDNDRLLSQLDELSESEVESLLLEMQQAGGAA